MPNCDVFVANIFESNRMATFTANWPHHRQPNLAPERMAQAGFYFDPDDENIDNVTCPFCLKSLTGWEKGDDPFAEHAKRKDVCYFARLNKDEKDWTTGEFLRLLAQRRACMLASIAQRAAESARQATKSVRDRIEESVENMKRKKPSRKKK